MASRAASGSAETGKNLPNPLIGWVGHGHLPHGCVAVGNAGDGKAMGTHARPILALDPECCST